MDSERTLRRPPLFHFFSPRPVVVKLRMRSPLPGTPTVSLGCHNHHQPLFFSFYSHSSSSFPSPSFPWSPRHEYTLNDTRPSQLYSHLVPPRYRYIPNNTSAVSVLLAPVLPFHLHLVSTLGLTASLPF